MAHEIKEVTSTFRFHIRESDEETKIKNIPHSTGLSKEDPNTFLFEFDVLYRSYDYVLGAKKWILFPDTLMNDALCLFIGPGKENITLGIR